MKQVRLFVLQDNCRRFIDVPYGQHAEIQADIEMTGGDVYHAVILNPPPKTRRSTSGAKLKKRLY
jgi:hypothetical protein